MTLPEIFARVTAENAASKEKSGFWRDIPERDQAEAIRGEFAEWHMAYVDGKVDGPHGEVEEAIDTINVLCRRIMFLTNEQDA